MTLLGRHTLQCGSVREGGREEGREGGKEGEREGEREYVDRGDVHTNYSIASSQVLLAKDGESLAS